MTDKAWLQVYYPAILLFHLLSSRSWNELQWFGSYSNCLMREISCTFIFIDVYWVINIFIICIFICLTVVQKDKKVLKSYFQTFCWKPHWSPSNYSPWEATHRFQCLIHPSKQIWNWFCGMAFRSAVVLLLMSSMSSKCLPFNISFIFGYRKNGG
jgi:hypothetical protein